MCEYARDWVSKLDKIVLSSSCSSDVLLCADIAEQVQGAAYSLELDLALGSTKKEAEADLH